MSAVRNESDFFNFAAGNWALEDLACRHIVFTCSTCPCQLFLLPVSQSGFLTGTMRINTPKKENKTVF